MKFVTDSEEKEFIRAQFWLQVNKNIMVDLIYSSLEFSFSFGLN